MLDEQGFLPITDSPSDQTFKIRYRRIGGEHPAKTPLLLLHGGPGALHNYLLNM